MEFKNLFPTDLYHSYIVEGEPVSTTLSLCEFLKNKEGNDIEILCQSYDSFSVADSELIKEWHSQKSINGNKRMCIISAKFINHDAERTLLKVIEEPAEHTHFFIVIPNALLLLDTIRSRSHIVKSDSNISNTQAEFKDIEKEVKTFLSSSFKDKLEIVGKIVKSHEDDNSGVSRYHAIEFLNHIEKIIYEKWKKNKNDKNLISILEEIGEKRVYLNQPGSGVKMILEHIAIMLE